MAVMPSEVKVTVSLDEDGLKMLRDVVNKLDRIGRVFGLDEDIDDPEETPEGAGTCIVCGKLHAHCVTDSGLGPFCIACYLASQTAESEGNDAT